MTHVTPFIETEHLHYRSPSQDGGTPYIERAEELDYNVITEDSHLSNGQATPMLDGLFGVGMACLGGKLGRRALIAKYYCGVSNLSRK